MQKSPLFALLSSGGASHRAIIFQFFIIIIICRKRQKKGEWVEKLISINFDCNWHFVIYCRAIALRSEAWRAFTNLMWNHRISFSILFIAFSLTRSNSNSIFSIKYWFKFRYAFDSLENSLSRGLKLKQVLIVLSIFSAVFFSRRHSLLLFAFDRLFIMNLNKFSLHSWHQTTRWMLTHKTSIKIWIYFQAITIYRLIALHRI